MAEHEPNQGLRELLTEARWSQVELAGAINRAAAEAGVPAACDKSNVNKWLSGTRPQAKWHPLIVEAFARRLGRPVTHAEAGLPGSVAETGALAVLALPGNTVEGLVSIGREDMDPSRRRFLATSLYAAALPVPAFVDLAGRAPVRAGGRTTRIGAGEVATVRTMTDRIADILDELGGGHARPMAAAFLVNTVATYLHADASDAVRKNMLAAASDLVYLTGWMAMYEKAHGLGQRYYVQALHLAAEAGDHVTYCRTLRGMALQAANLKQGKRALELADSAAEAAPKAGPRLQAFLAGQQAQGAALVGDGRLAFSRLAQTQAALSRADNRRDTIGGYDQAAYFFHVSSVLHALGDVPGSITAMQDSNRVRPPVEKQGRAHANGLLAQRQLEVGHLEASCATWSAFLDDYEHLSSSRADEHFGILRRRLRRHVGNRHACEVYERAGELARRKAA
ncbi:hypothetical protein [Actinacidiphila rubida]|uniref:Regulatory protein n=1 Tax=Actinacidiphila rubida TaxID=310780 RepID=A0A1H8MDB2_9ACTN|nr:hypothetical protein [Actinacidiphila rubida]SEO15250.1 hypothetical protein SAMN05216267_1018149 [Actinacidiphila rubida]